MIRFEDENGHGVYWYDTADVAKAIELRVNGKIIGRNKFMQYLRFNNVIMKDSNQPKQNMITLGLMRFHMVTRRYKQYGMPLFSDRGIAYIQRRISSGEFQIGFMKRIEKYKPIKNLNEVC
jgi:hypothetical protein